MCKQTKMDVYKTQHADKDCLIIFCIICNAAKMECFRITKLNIEVESVRTRVAVFTPAKIDRKTHKIWKSESKKKRGKGLALNYHNIILIQKNIGNINQHVLLIRTHQHDQVKQYVDSPASLSSIIDSTEEGNRKTELLGERN